MQTFLPYPDFYDSAAALDKKRCWKQVVEASQIIKVLEGTTTAWANHPAVRMWKGYEKALDNYYNAFLHISINKHNINTQMSNRPAWLRCDTPWWLGVKDFHRAMRARLLDKDFEYYRHVFKLDDWRFNEGMYFWPNPDKPGYFTVIMGKLRISYRLIGKHKITKI